MTRKTLALLLDEEPTKASIEAALLPFHRFEETGIEAHLREIDLTGDMQALYATQTATRLRDRFGILHHPDLPCLWSASGDGETQARDAFEEVTVPLENVYRFDEFVASTTGLSPLYEGDEPDLVGLHRFGHIATDEAGVVTRVVRRTNPRGRWARWQMDASEGRIETVSTDGLDLHALSGRVRVATLALDTMTDRVRGARLRRLEDACSSAGLDLSTFASLMARLDELLIPVDDERSRLVSPAIASGIVMHVANRTIARRVHAVLGAIGTLPRRGIEAWLSQTPPIEADAILDGDVWRERLFADGDLMRRLGETDLGAPEPFDLAAHLRSRRQAFVVLLAYL